jgi:hypothetical protein
MKAYIAKLNETQDKIITETAEKLKSLGLLETGSKYEITKLSLYTLVILFNKEKVNEFRGEMNNGKK